MPNWVEQVKTADEMRAGMQAMLPDFWAAMYEMVELLRAEATITRAALVEVIRARQNLYISTCDVATLGEFETAFGLPAAAGATEDERREQLLAHMRGFGKVSASKLKTMVEAFVGLESEVTFELGVITVACRTQWDRTLPLTEIKAIVERRVPAHLQVNVLRMFTNWREMNENFTWTTAGAYTWYQLKNEKVVE